MDLIYKDEVYNIIGAAMEVHNELGCGFFEAVYHEALEIELLTQEIPFKKEEKIEIYYKDYLLSKFYVADFICYDKIILEIKALSELTSINEAQMLNYLKATGSKIGLLINFGTERLQFKRYVY
ncbi:GxxExxY protein [Bacteroidales bacterium OttesenSCG-928-L14]|nr:GxxExxY protein [Bacteroidales bacterium OttesenSCG-928-L14]